MQIVAHNTSIPLLSFSFSLLFYPLLFLAGYFCYIRILFFAKINKGLSFLYRYECLCCLFRESRFMKCIEVGQ